ncbi:MAG: hypothetical protein IJ880_00130 [Bacilli bacterium]|nr:hypothetical protein [Bacilli bacterium]
MLQLIRMLVKEGLVPSKAKWISTNGEDSCYPNDGYFECTQEGTAVNFFTSELKFVSSEWYSMTRIIVRYHGTIVYDVKADSEGEEFDASALKIFDALNEAK